MKPAKFLFLAAFILLLSLPSCKQPVDLPTGVEVLINGESIEGEKEITVPRGSEVSLFAKGLEGLSAIDLVVRKLGIAVYEGNFQADADGIVDKSFELPDMDASATAVVNYTDANGGSHEDKFTIKLR